MGSQDETGATTTSFAHGLALNSSAEGKLIDKLVLANIAQNRGDVLVTAVFNILAASAIVLGICYDSYRAWKKELSYRREYV